MSTSHHHPSVELPPPRLEEVADGVFAHVQLDGSWGLNNSGFLRGSDAVVAVDTAFTERRTRLFLDALRGVTDRPVRTLVNTHHHGDHTHGNALLGPAVTVVGHTRCRTELLAAGHAAKGLFPGVEWGELPLAPPTVTFDDHLTVWVDDVAVELRHLGVAHTTNDVVALVPERGVVFAGDLVFHGGTPFVLMGSVAGAIEALDRLEALGARTIVPGHGPVCGPEVLEGQRRYLRFVLDVAEEGRRAGLGPLEAAREADLGEFAGWLDAERLVGNLHRAYAEAEGRPVDLLGAFAEMVEFNGGEPLRCWA